jgi:hypothetical protein
MDRKEVRKAWDDVSDTYADSRDPTGSASVDLRTEKVSDPLGTDAEFVFGTADTATG